MVNNKTDDTVWLMCECATNPEDIKMEILNEAYIDGATGRMPIVTIEATAQSFNVENWNKRIYDDFVVMPALDGDGMIQHDMKHGQWCGEFGHPLDLDPRRQMIINPQTSSHRILKYWKQGNLLKIHARTLPYGFGGAMAANSLDGVPAAFSMRGMGSVDLATRRAKSPLKIVAYDYVYRPSHKEAYEDRILSETAGGILLSESAGGGIILSESAGSIYIPKNNDMYSVYKETNLIIPVKKEKIILIEQAVDFIQERSDNIKIIRDMFKVDSFESAVLSESGTFVNLTINEGTVARIPIEKAISLQYGDMLSGFDVKRR